MNNYITFRIQEDSTVGVRVQSIEADTLKIIKDESFEGRINNGKNNGCVYFYKTK